MRKHGFKKVIVGGVLTVALALTAVAAQGSAEDPLVTLGYLTEQFLPRVVSEVEVKMAERDKQLEDKIQAMANTYAMDMERKFQRVAGGSGSVAVTPGFFAVTLTDGQTLKLASGSEVLFRSGKALCTSPSSPGLVDMTAGGILEDRSAPQANHLYLATAADRGIVASGDVTLLVRGEFTVE